MSSLAKIHADLHPAGGLCKLGHILSALDTDDRAWLTETLAKPVKVESHQALAETLETAGHPVSADVIGRHRRGECACAGGTR